MRILKRPHLTQQCLSTESCSLALVALALTLGFLRSDSPGLDGDMTQSPRRLGAEPARVKSAPTAAVAPSDSVKAIDASPKAPKKSIWFVPTALPEAPTAGAEEATQVRLNQVAQDELGKAKIDVGRIEPALEKLRTELARSVADIPETVDFESAAKKGEAVVKAWQPGAQRYGETSVPYRAPNGYVSQVPSELQRAAETGNAEAIEAVRGIEKGQRLMEFAEGAGGDTFTALIEVSLTPQGAAAAKLVKYSGRVAFDKYVLEQAESTVKALAENPNAPKVSQASRSVWEYTGKVVFMRKVSKLSVKDAPSLIALGALATLAKAPLALKTDFVSGSPEYIDFAHPRYSCQVKLLSVAPY